MPYTPQFGGTNGVPELDAGQPGGTRYANGWVRYVVNVLERPPEVRDVLHALPEQNRSFLNRLGWTGQVVMWQGRVLIKDDAEMAALRSELSKYAAGMSIDSSTGAHSTVNASYRSATVLKDNFGKALAASAVMAGYRFEENFRRITGRAGFLYTNRLVIVFRILG